MKTMARILIAEDEEGLRSLVARALAQDGHEVVTANDGAEALDALTRERGRSSCCSPTSACRSWTASRWRLRRRATIPNCTILLMTGYADQRERASGLDALIHDVIAKPFTLASIRSAVRMRWPPPERAVN